MFGSFFGEYLQQKNIITEEQFCNLIEEQKNTRVKLGLLAVESKLMTVEQADQVNNLQAVMDKRFGDIAVEKGYLTESQVEELLKKQGDAYFTFVQCLIDKGMLSLSQIEEQLDFYQKENKFTTEEINLLKSGDIDKIVPIFLKEVEDNVFVKDVVSLICRNLVRFIDNQIIIQPIEKIKKYDAQGLVVQNIVGNPNILTGFSAQEKLRLIPFASMYAKEKFEEFNVDILDSIGEFLNCSNGLYVSKMSREDIEFEMNPPIFYENLVQIVGEFYKVTIGILGKRVDFIIAAGDVPIVNEK